jgi:hypothetical protein
MSVFSHDGKLIGTYNKRSIKRGENHPRTLYVLYEEFKPAMNNVEIDNYAIGKDSDTPSIAVPLSHLGKRITSDCIDEVCIEGLHDCNPIDMKELKEIIKGKDKITAGILRTWLKENELSESYDLDSNDLKKAARFINSLKEHIEFR